MSALELSEVSLEPYVVLTTRFSWPVIFACSNRTGRATVLPVAIYFENLSLISIRS